MLCPPGHNESSGEKAGSRIVALSARADLPAEEQMETLFDERAAAWLHVRHAEAGCFIARVDRADAFDLATTG